YGADRGCADASDGQVLVRLAVSTGDAPRLDPASSLDEGEVDSRRSLARRQVRAAAVDAVCRAAGRVDAAHFRPAHDPHPRPRRRCVAGAG
ncbi:MAG TPA: hypothetical protein VMX56_04140, partial [Anaerolineales bacterium]|nr:hypothetical protein [Anaerolineales bacterium]